MMVEEGEGGCPEGPVSRPVRERQLSRQRGGQREGAGGGTKAWHATHAPTSLRCAHTGLPSSPRPVLHCSQHPKNPTVQWSCSLSRRGLSLQHVGQWSCSLSCGGSPCSTWSVVLFSLVRGLSLQHMGQWSCSLSRRGSPSSTWVSGPVLSRAGALPAAHGSVVLFSLVWGLSLQHVGQWSCPLSRGALPAAHGSVSTLSLEYQPPSLLMFSFRLQGPLSPGFLLPIWPLLLPFLPTSKRWWAPEVGPQTASLYFWCHEPFVSLPTYTF